MILSRIEAVRTRVDEYTRLSRINTQADNIQKTAEALRDVNNEIAQWTEIFPLLAPHSPEEEVATIRGQARQVRDRLERSQHAFENDLNQVPNLNRLGIKGLMDNTARSWFLYAGELLRPYEQLISVAEQLPKMRTSMDEIRVLHHKLDRQKNALPRNVRAWKSFQEQYAALAAALDVLEGLDESKRVFLEKVQNKRATLADLSPELLAWCREEGLADELKIGF